MRESLPSMRKRLERKYKQMEEQRNFVNRQREILLEIEEEATEIRIAIAERMRG